MERNQYWRRKMPQALAVVMRAIPGNSRAAEMATALDRADDMEPTRLSSLLDSALRLAAEHDKQDRH